MKNTYNTRFPLKVFILFSMKIFPNTQPNVHNGTNSNTDNLQNVDLLEALQLCLGVLAVTLHPGMKEKLSNLKFTNALATFIKIQHDNNKICFIFLAREIKCHCILYIY